MELQDFSSLNTLKTKLHLKPILSTSNSKKNGLLMSSKTTILIWPLKQEVQSSPNSIHSNCFKTLVYLETKLGISTLWTRRMTFGFPRKIWLRPTIARHSLSIWHQIKGKVNSRPILKTSMRRYLGHFVLLEPNLTSKATTLNWASDLLYHKLNSLLDFFISISVIDVNLK